MLDFRSDSLLFYTSFQQLEQVYIASHSRLSRFLRNNELTAFGAIISWLSTCHSIICLEVCELIMNYFRNMYEGSSVEQRASIADVKTAA